MCGDEPLPPISAALWKRERRHVWIEREISFSYYSQSKNIQLSIDDR